MDAFWWIFTILVFLTGLFGSLLPFIPGTTVVFAGAVLHRLMLGAEQSIGWVTLAVLGFLLVASYIIDFISGAAGAKYFGASRWGAIGGILGATVGIFFGLPGIFIGPLVGALAGELLGGKGILPAGRSGLGSLIGTTVGILSKFAIASAMITVFFAGWFLRG